MNNKNKLFNDTRQNIYENKKGFVVLMTILILIFIFSATLGASKMFNNAIKMGVIQAQFTKAYFASESGLEKALWEYSKNNFVILGASDTSDVFVDTLANDSDYSVDIATSSDADYRYEKFISVGGYEDVKRSVEASFKILK